MSRRLPPSPHALPSESAMNPSSLSPSRRLPAAGRRHATPALLLAALLAACSGQDAAAPAAGASAPKAASAAAPAADPLRVVAPASLLDRLVLVEAGLKPIAEPLAVTARIDFNEQSVARIGASVTGRVTEMQALPGQAVRAGQVLAQLHSTELGGAQLAYLKANAQRELAAKAVERAHLLLAADVIGSAELQRRENELGVAEAERRAAADQLRVMGVSAASLAETTRSGAITSTSTVVSTVSGVVVERKIAKGQVVQPADVLYTVADLSRVWVLAQVPEADIARVRPGQKVHIELASSDIAPVQGELSWVADTVNPETRTVTVRSEIANPQRLLKPAMLARMVIDPLPAERLVVPASAVVREDNQDHVFVQVGAPAERVFRLTKVKLGLRVNGSQVVDDGLQPGMVVVTDGAFHLNNERKRAEMEGS